MAEASDDNFAIVQRHLTNRGFRVRGAANGRVVVKEAARTQYSLILGDVEMPEIDGFDATRMIRAAETERGEFRCPYSH